MNRPSFIMLLLLACSAAYSQEPLGSVSFAEMEDSISQVSFVRIRKPKALLDSIIVQVIRDSQQKPVRCKYQTKYTTGLHTDAPHTSRCILHALANIKIKTMEEGEAFHYEGPILPRNLYDTARVYFLLRDIIEGDYMLRLVQTDSERSVFQGFKYMMGLHHIKVYSIGDDSGRGVYRVDFSPRKNIGYGYSGSKYNGTAYFDRNTLRIKQIETDKIMPTSFDIFGRQDKEGLLSHTSCKHYRIDFEEVGGTLVVKQIENTYFVDNQLTAKYRAQRLP
ncbi:MAG: hypothetical protein IJ219_10675 [Bacteroidaceae bacterium]|nr:hypothetical protein [Bacteroidaceae bacterium]